MKKNIIIVVSILAGVAVLITGTVIGFDMWMRKDEAKGYTWTCERYGAVKYWEEKDRSEYVAILYDSCDEFLEYKNIIDKDEWATPAYKEKLNSYDEAFFEENVLIMKYYELNSGSIKLSLKRLDVIDGKGIIRMQRKSSGYGTDDMAHWTVFIEVDKDEGITSVE